MENKLISISLFEYQNFVLISNIMINFFFSNYNAVIFIKSAVIFALSIVLFLDKNLSRRLLITRPVSIMMGLCIDWHFCLSVTLR